MAKDSRRNVTNGIDALACVHYEFRESAAIVRLGRGYAVPLSCRTGEWDAFLFLNFLLRFSGFRPAKR